MKLALGQAEAEQKSRILRLMLQSTGTDSVFLVKGSVKELKIKLL